jgi:hypothetical protein
MAYTPVSFLASQYDEQDGWFLKFYLAGTTTPFAMSIDASGATTLDKAQLDVDGFITTDGTEIFIPFVDQIYDAFLFPTAAEADTNDTTNAKRIAENINPFGESVTSAKIDASFTTDGGAAYSISTPVTSVSVHINGRFQDSGTYTLVTSTGTITFNEAPSTGQLLVISYNEITGTSISFDKTFEVVSLSDYVTDVNDANSALEAACIDGAIVDFAGLNLTFPTDFNMPLTSRCSEWRFNGAAVNFLTGVCNLGTNSITIDLQGGALSLGIKKALVTVNSIGGSNQFTVSNAIDFSVGDQVSCSFDNQYLPNSTSQLGTLGEFNTITDITSNVITVKFNVPAVVPANAWLLNGRFDKNGIDYSGTGYLRIKNGTVNDCRSGYFVALTDATQQSKFYTENVVYENAALDQFFFECHSAFFKGCHIGRSYDIAKQAIVDDHNEEGLIELDSCTVKRFNGDALFFRSGNVGKTGDIRVKDCFIDGFNDMSFSGSAQDFQDTNTLHLWSYSGSDTDPEMGNILIEGGKIINVARSVFGTTFSNRNTFNFSSFTMKNVDCETDPINMRIDDQVNSSIGSILIDTCNTITTTNDLGSGLSVDNATNYIFRGGTLKPNSIPLGNSLCKISRNAIYNTKLMQGDLGESFQVSGRGSILNQVRLDKAPITINNQLQFLESYPQLEQTKLIFSGKDFTDIGYPDPSEWITDNDSKTPNFIFNFPFVGVEYEYGDQAGGVVVPFVARLQAEQWNLPPYPSLGHYTIWVPNGSTIEGAGGQRGLVSDVFSTTINAATSAGNNVITVASIPSGMVAGSLIGLADIEGSSLMAYWYKIQSIAGLDITLTANLDIDVGVANPVQGINVVPESSYKNVVVNNIAPGALAPEFIGQQYIDTSVPNTYIGHDTVASAWTQTN